MFFFREGEAPTAPSPPALSPGGGRFFRSTVVGFVSGGWRLPQSCVAGFSLFQLVGSVLDLVGALSVLFGSWFLVLCSIGRALDWIDVALRSVDKAWKRRVGLDGGSSVFLSSRFAVVELRRGLEMVAVKSRRKRRVSCWWGLILPRVLLPWRAGLPKSAEFGLGLRHVNLS